VGEVDVSMIRRRSVAVEENRVEEAMDEGDWMGEGVLELRPREPPAVVRGEEIHQGEDGHNMEASVLHDCSRAD
jgi:hypothetical protein